MRKVISFISIGFLLIVVVAELPWTIFPFELFVHFRVQLAVGTCFVFSLFLLRRQYLLAVLAICAFALNLRVLLPYYLTTEASLPYQTSVKPPREIRILSANISVTNPLIPDLLKRIEAINPDVIALTEVTEPLQRELSHLKVTYPHSASYPPGIFAGPVLYTRFPVKYVMFEKQTVQLEVQLDLGEKAVRVFVVSSPPPITGAKYIARNRVFKILKNRLGNESSEAIVVGDFNSAPWAVPFSNFIRQANLKDARLGQGIFPTWPKGFLPVRIPIDHCLVGNSFLVTALTVIDVPGSDHFGLLCEVEI